VTSDAEASPGPNPSAPTILVVDDDDRLRSLLSRYLAENGFRVTTAANASTINDGAAAVVLATRKCAEEAGLTPLARIVAYAETAREPAWFTLAPIDAIRKVLTSAKLTPGDIDLWEINEAFAVVTLAAMRELELDPERVNVNGGAIALGHPLGCTGAKLTAGLLQELKRRNAKYGIVTMCVGGGMGAAGIFENLN